MQRDRLPNALAAACGDRLDRDQVAHAVADDRDSAVVPLPVRARLPFERASRWMVLDARKLPAARSDAP